MVKHFEWARTGDPDLESLRGTKEFEALLKMFEAFFAKFGIEETDLKGFKAEIRKNMEREVKQALHAKLKNDVLNELVKINEIEVPQALTDGEVDRLRQQAVQQFGGGANLDPSNLPAELFTEQAKRRVAIGLLVGELIQSNELKADADRVRSTIEEMAETYQQPQEVIDYLIQRSRPQLFSNALPPTVACSAAKAIEILKREPELVARLHQNVHRMRTGLRSLGFEVLESPTAILPIIIGDTAEAISLSNRLLKMGVFVIGFGFPVVPEGTARLRIQMSAAHTDEHIDRALEAFAKLK